MNGTFLKVLAGFGGELKVGGARLRAVLVEGEATLNAPKLEASETPGPRRYFGAPEDCLFDIRT